jgi:hypothetical protein
VLGSPSGSSSSRGSRLATRPKQRHGEQPTRRRAGRAQFVSDAPFSGGGSRHGGGGSSAAGSFPCVLTRRRRVLQPREQRGTQACTPTVVGGQRAWGTAACGCRRRCPVWTRGGVGDYLDSRDGSGGERRKIWGGKKKMMWRRGTHELGRRIGKLLEQIVFWG